MSWSEVASLTQIPRLGARVLQHRDLRIALFRTSDDLVFAMEDRCPHRGGPLSQGIVHGACVTCPLHDWVIDLTSGKACGADEGSVPTFPVSVVDGRVFIDLSAALHRDGRAAESECVSVAARAVGE